MSSRDIAISVGAGKTALTPGPGRGRRALLAPAQGQAAGAGAPALNLGIALGWLQQGARASNRPVSLATGDLQSAKPHAANASYHSYDGYISSALTKLNAGQPVSAVLGEATALVAIFQGQVNH